MEEIFESAVRSNEDLAGVFEYDGEVAFFYLYDANATAKHKIMGAIRVATGDLNMAAEDVLVRWDSTEEHVGLWLKGDLRAAFAATTRTKFGGEDASSIPEYVINLFDPLRSNH
jgi:hypothetical protein